MLKSTLIKAGATALSVVAVAGIAGAPLTGGLSLIATAACVGVGFAVVAKMTKNDQKQKNDDPQILNNGERNEQQPEEKRSAFKTIFKTISSGFKEVMNVITSYDEDKVLGGMGVANLKGNLVGGAEFTTNYSDKKTSTPSSDQATSITTHNTEKSDKKTSTPSSDQATSITTHNTKKEVIILTNKEFSRYKNSYESIYYDNKVNATLKFLESGSEIKATKERLERYGIEEKDYKGFLAFINKDKDSTQEIYVVPSEFDNEKNPSKEFKKYIPLGSYKRETYKDGFKELENSEKKNFIKDNTIITSTQEQKKLNTNDLTTSPDSPVKPNTLVFNPPSINTSKGPNPSLNVGQCR
jgi:hypothetical protein